MRIAHSRASSRRSPMHARPPRQPTKRSSTSRGGSGQIGLALAARARWAPRRGARIARRHRRHGGPACRRPSAGASSCIALESRSRSATSRKPHRVARRRRGRRDARIHGRERAGAGGRSRAFSPRGSGPPAEIGSARGAELTRGRADVRSDARGAAGGPTRGECLHRPPEKIASGRLDGVRPALDAALETPSWRAAADRPVAHRRHRRPRPARSPAGSLCDRDPAYRRRDARSGVDRRRRQPRLRPARVALRAECDGRQSARSTRSPR